MVENLCLQDGEQNRLVVAKEIYSSDNVKLVARVIRQYLAEEFVPLCKYVVDNASSSVYILAPDADVATMLAGHSFSVEVDGIYAISFYRVMSFERRPQDQDMYQSVACQRVNP